MRPRIAAKRRPAPNIERESLPAECRNRRCPPSGGPALGTIRVLCGGHSGNEKQRKRDAEISRALRILTGGVGVPVGSGASIVIRAEAVAGSGASDAKSRAAAETRLAALGRLREPVLRRIMAITADDGIKTQAERLIAEGGAGGR